MNFFYYNIENQTSRNRSDHGSGRSRGYSRSRGSGSRGRGSRGNSGRSGGNQPDISQLQLTHIEVAFFTS
jgi:hypothetical protein